MLIYIALVLSSYPELSVTHHTHPSDKLKQNRIGNRVKHPVRRGQSVVGNIVMSEEVESCWLAG